MRRALKILAAVGAAAFGVFGYVYLTLPDVRSLATVNPTRTAFMELRAREAAAAGRKLRHEQRWVPYSRISQPLKRAVLVAEDSAFWDHEGVDLIELRKAMEASFEDGTAPRGASTITQQLAKNLYLSPARDPLRKLRELIIARRLEAALSKARIFEIYLNVIEWGDGVWGAEAAARRYFGVSASGLEPQQAALLAGAIINPRVHNPGRPTARLMRRQRIILGRMGGVTPPSPTPILTPEPPPDDMESELPPELDPSPDEAPADPVEDTVEPASPIDPVEPAIPPPAEVSSEPPQ